MSDPIRNPFEFPFLDEKHFVEQMKAYHFQKYLEKCRQIPCIPYEKRTPLHRYVENCRYLMRSKTMHLHPVREVISSPTLVARARKELALPWGELTTRFLAVASHLPELIHELEDAALKQLRGWPQFYFPNIRELSCHTAELAGPGLLSVNLENIRDLHPHALRLISVDARLLTLGLPTLTHSHAHAIGVRVKHLITHSLAPGTAGILTDVSPRTYELEELPSPADCVALAHCDYASKSTVIIAPKSSVYDPTPPNPLELFRDFQGALHFYSGQLTPDQTEVCRSLRAHTLCLDNQCWLDPNVAGHLAEFQGSELHLDTHMFEDSALENLLHFQGTLHIGLFDKLSDREALALSFHEHPVHLPDVNSLTDRQLKALCERPAPVFLRRGCIQFSPSQLAWLENAGQTALRIEPNYHDPYRAHSTSQSGS